jgi:hypothetical protein
MAMKTTQAWGWLAAGVLAAGLNASYHDGGLRVAHRVVSRLEHRSEALLTLASARTEQFLAETAAETRLVTAWDEAASCRLSTALAQARTRIARSDARMARVEVMSASDEAQLAQFEANRAQIEAQLQEAQDQVQARVAEVQARVQANVVRIRMPAVALSPVVVSTPKVLACSRIRVNIPQPPVVRIPSVPVIHIETSGTGPI